VKYVLAVLPLIVDVAIESEQLGHSFPPDPADRLIAATARVHNLTLITSNRPTRKSAAVRTLWWSVSAEQSRPSRFSRRDLGPNPMTSAGLLSSG
jgi:hypothetical protein